MEQNNRNQNTNNPNTPTPQQGCSVPLQSDRLSKRY